MKKVLLLIVVLGITFSLFSQVNTKHEKVLKMIEISGSSRLGEQVAKTLINSIKGSYANVPSEFWDNFAKEIKADDLRELVIPIYEKYYSEEDIDNLIVFYSSPTGQKMIQVAPMIMQESISVGQAWGEKIGTKVIEELQRNGYIKD